MKYTILSLAFIPAASPALAGKCTQKMVQTKKAAYTNMYEKLKKSRPKVAMAYHEGLPAKMLIFKENSSHNCELIDSLIRDLKVNFVQK